MIALFGDFAQAQLLDSIMAEYGVAETAAGFLFSSEMLSYFLTIFCTAWPLARWSRARTALIGCVIAIAANVASAYAPSFEMLVGLRVVAGFGAGLALTDDGTLYIALNILWNLAYYFVVPYLMGALAALDDLGCWAVAGDAFWNAGIVPGPIIAGALVEGVGYVPLSVMALVAGLGCMFMLLGVLTRLEAIEASESPA